MIPGMKAYSVDLRQRVLAAVDRGMPRSQVVATFGVSLATLKRWLILRRSCPELPAQSPPGRPGTIGPEQEAALRAQLAEHPDATFAQHAQLWQAGQGSALSEWTLGRAIRRLGWTRKKSRSGPASGTRSTAKPSGLSSPLRPPRPS